MTQPGTGAANAAMCTAMRARVAPGNASHLDRTGTRAVITARSSMHIRPCAYRDEWRSRMLRCTNHRLDARAS